MINCRIFSMTNAATNMLNTNILDVLGNMNSSSKHANVSIAKQFGIRLTYRTVVEEAAVGVDRFTAPRAVVMLLTMTLVQTGRRRRHLRRRAATGWKMTRGGSSEQSRTVLPKNLIRPLTYRITKAIGSGDLLSQTPVHADAWDEVDYGGSTRHEISKT